MGQSSYTSWIVRQRNRKGAYTNKWAVTWLPGNSRSSCERPSVRDLTAALDALYAALPLFERMRSDGCRGLDVAQEGLNGTHGGFVIPCLEPVFIITDGFS